VAAISTAFSQEVFMSRLSRSVFPFVCAIDFHQAAYDNDSDSESEYEWVDEEAERLQLEKEKQEEEAAKAEKARLKAMTKKQRKVCEMLGPGLFDRALDLGMAAGAACLVARKLI
jgi:hypothetical protein